MSDTTPNYGFTLPIIGGSDTLWGGLLNGNWSALDTLLKAMNDAITAAAAAAEARKIPINGLYFSATTVDPATVLGYGTWVPYAAGRAVVGVGNNGQSAWTGAQERGTETHALTEAELASHTHTVPAHSGTAGSAGAHTHAHPSGGAFIAANAGGIPGFDNGGLYGPTNSNPLTASAGAHTHDVNIPEVVTQAKGAGTPHENVQPSIGVFIWRRSA